MRLAIQDFILENDLILGNDLFSGNDLTLGDDSIFGNDLTLGNDSIIEDALISEDESETEDLLTGYTSSACVSDRNINWASSIPTGRQDTIGTAALFKHKPLPEGPWIRLIDIEPAAKHAPIRCTVTHMLLDDVAGEYDALSYVWGTDKNVHWISVNDERFAIRENLYHFLVGLRASAHSTPLWADVLFIEQDNLTEKNRQVQQMSKVYRNSRLTKIWLGQGSDGMWKTIREARRDSDLLKKRSWCNEGEMRSVCKRASKNLKTIINAGYWSRLWIVQEVLLSPNLQIYIGGLTVNYADFMRFCKDNGGLLSGNTMNTLYTQRLHREDRTLPELIQAHQSTLCSDPKDRVFGLLGLVSDFTVDVDYQQSRTSLFQKVLQKYPAQYANVLAQPLALALEIVSESVPSPLKPSEVVLRAKECGALVEGCNGLSWDCKADHVLRLKSHGAKSLMPGDKTISLLSHFDALVSEHPCYLLIVRQIETSETERDSRGKPTRIGYEVVGSATTQHKRSKPGAHQSPIEPAVRNVRACRNLESCGYGAISIHMSVEDFLKIDAAGGFPTRPDIKQEFHGIVTGHDASIAGVEKWFNGDDDYDESQWGIPA